MLPGFLEAGASSWTHILETGVRSITYPDPVFESQLFLTKSRKVFQKEFIQPGAPDQSELAYGRGT